MSVLNMAREHTVLLHRGIDSGGLGFSLLGTPHLPPIIYDILENSPAAASGEVEAGDVILKINETDVYRFTTKEVLRCLRMSGDTVRLVLKRDPAIKEQVIQILSSQNRQTDSAASQELLSTEPVEDDDTFATDDDLQRYNNNNKPKKPRFEAFMMTGDLILNLSRNQQTAGILPKNQKKIDSLRSHRHRSSNVNSVPTSPNESEVGGRRGTSPPPCSLDESSNNSGYSFQTGVRTSKSEDHLQFQKDSSLSAVDIDIDEDVTSSLNTLLDTRQDSSCGSLSIQGARTHSDPSSNVTVLHISETGEWEKETKTKATVEKIAVVDHQLEPGSCTCSPLREKRRSHDKEQRHSGHFDKSENRRSGHFEKADGRQNRLSGHFDKHKETENRRSGHFERDENHRHSGHFDAKGNGDGKYVQHNMKHSGSSDPPSGSSDLSPPSGGSPTSVSSSLLSSSPRGTRGGGCGGCLVSDPSASNISSPDYHEEMTLDLLSAMEMTDPSDSDSTILVSERSAQPHRDDAKIVCYVEPPPDGLRTTNGSLDFDDVGSSPPHSQGSAEDDSDIESLESFHFEYSPKAVDMPSAIRLAKRLFSLDGFKKSDVSRHLSKNNEFSKAVAEEYLKYFTFEGDTLDVALRKFLKQFALTGETQERERVLVHFSKRYLDCNPRSFNSTDAVHTLTCALMLLNTDLHGQNLSRKMTCEEFIDNLRELNDGQDFPRESLKALYRSIVFQPVEWAIDDDDEHGNVELAMREKDELLNMMGGQSNPFLSYPDPNAPAVEHKKGYVMRKCCLDLNGKRTPFGKRGWKMLYCTLRDMVLYLHKDEHGFRKSQLTDSIHNAIRIHHSLATRATDYAKKQHVFRLQTAERAEFLFQTSDSKELQSWVDTINLVAAWFSAQPLSSAVGSADKFQRPLLPSSRTKLSSREQLLDHEERVKRLEAELDDHRKRPPERGAKTLVLHNYKEKDSYLQFEVRRYTTYARILRARMQTFVEAEEGRENGGGGVIPPPVPERQVPNVRDLYNGLLLKGTTDR